MKKKLLVFHKALAPYRIDLFNELNEAFEMNIYFFRKNLRSQKFDMNAINAQLNFIPKYMTSGFDFGNRKRMIRFGFLNKIIQHKPDVLICLEYSYITFIAAAFTKLIFPKTKVYSICDDSVDVAKRCSNMRKIGRSLCFIFLDGIVLGNDFAEEWYNTLFPTIKTIVFPIIQKEERIKDIIKSSHPITKNYIEKFSLQNKNILLFVGRLVEVKNLNLLIDVFSKYVLKNRNTVLILVGDGDKKSGLINQVNELMIQENVIFAGRYEHEELYAWYPIADNFILPSTSEVFGAVVNESLIAGVPVICSDLAGASCLINDKNGVTFNPYNKEMLLSIFNKKLSIKRESINDFSSENSLMPYTLTEKIHSLLSFLKAE